MLAATGLALVGFGIDFGSHAEALLSPRANAWSATVAALLAYAGLHALLVLLIGGFCGARSFAGLLSQRHRAALDTLRGAVHAGTVQTLLILLVVRGLPAWSA